MPGILPMKVIRVGSAQQSRIAQACDRCRSKKIRCDGIRPTCTQCSNVGFECKTSDKLSRRAFPRGYTESLEDRVRGLEAEVRELKDLLDEKDEKIDMLSRIHDFSPASRKGSSSLSPANSADVKAELASARADMIHVESTVPYQSSITTPGLSSTASFGQAFISKVQESGRSDVSTSFSTIEARCWSTSTIAPPPKSIFKIPPRLVSDQHINLFFQEWQPLLPILHRPSFLRVYEQYLNSPELTLWDTDRQAYAQLHLIFDVAALSSVSRTKQNTVTYEAQWRKALHSISSTACVASIQCHVLAQLYYLLKADYSHLARHRAFGVSMCHQLGLHQDHKYEMLSPLDAETRKKVFWCQYILDRFTSAADGTPMLLRDGDITAEYPADVDDENISKDGFALALPGENTRISSALEFFKVAKVLGQVLEQLYPSRNNYQISMNKLHTLSEELDQWLTNLPSHLRLKFVKDKPSTNVVSCRSPLLSLAYFYVRNLIHRPLICHGSGRAASATTIVLAAAAKHTLQILELLDERRMNYTFPVSKTELLLFSGFSLLWQCIDLEKDSKIIKDNQKTLNALTEMLTRDSQSLGEEFFRIGSGIVTLIARPSIGSQPSKPTVCEGSSARSLGSMPAPKQSSTKKGLQAIAARFPALSNKFKPGDDARRATVTCGRSGLLVSPHHRAYSTLGLTTTKSTPALPTYSPSSAGLLQTRTIDTPSNVNLDYLPFDEDEKTVHTSTRPMKHQVGNSGLGDASWEQLLTNIDSGFISIYDGPVSNSTVNPAAVSPVVCDKPDSKSNGREWPPPDRPSLDDPWPELGAIDLSMTTKAAVPQSVLSLSEESLTSGEDLVFSAAGSNHGSTATSEPVDLSNTNTPSGFKGIIMPTVGMDDDFEFGNEFESHY